MNGRGGIFPLNVAVNGVAQAAAVAFPTASAYVQLSAATVCITFTDATTSAVVLQLDNVVLSAHMAGVTQESVMRIVAAALENIQRCARGEEPHDVVTGHE